MGTACWETKIVGVPTAALTKKCDEAHKHWSWVYTTTDGKCGWGCEKADKKEKVIKKEEKTEVTSKVGTECWDTVSVGLCPAALWNSCGSCAWVYDAAGKCGWGCEKTTAKKEKKVEVKKSKVGTECWDTAIVGLCPVDLWNSCKTCAWVYDAADKCGWGCKK